MNADLIVVVEQGKVIEKGNHAELVGKNGRYADLWSKQAFVKPHRYTEDQDIIINDLGDNVAAADAGKANDEAKGGKDAKAEESEANGTPRHAKEVRPGSNGA